MYVCGLILTKKKTDERSHGPTLIVEKFSFWNAIEYEYHTNRQMEAEFEERDEREEERKSLKNRWYNSRIILTVFPPFFPSPSLEWRHNMWFCTSFADVQSVLSKNIHHIYLRCFDPVDYPLQTFSIYFNLPTVKWMAYLIKKIKWKMPKRRVWPLIFAGFLRNYA